MRTARAAFADDPCASLQSIAKASGVGQGTLYRHFPSREALLSAVCREEVEALVAAAPDLLARHEPLGALRLWFEHLMAYGRSGHVAALAVEAATRADRGGRDRPPATAALDLLLSAGKEARQVRPDAEADEVLLLGACLWQTGGGPASRERCRRMLTLILDGLRIGARG
ncbi:TetR/AcrR family transcriptional regulator [Streptomyces sp. enrichment culture]|uniref:TetR/AcrR family transcriptional regulator n=1 Tax=Streptomyces sp. enrichment culture TaxID=1795815 RepID=UPI003F54DCA8